MTNFKIRKIATVQGLYDTHEETIYSDIETNPGSTLAEITTNTGLASVIVTNVLETMEGQQIVKRRLDLSGGIAYYWRMVDWVPLILTNRNAARTWLTTHDGSSVSDLATDLSIPEPVAEALAKFLQQEYSAVLTLL